MFQKKKKIIFSGGGTMGSVSPLLALFDVLKKRNNFEFLWVGTLGGPEKEVIEKEKIDFMGIQGGKLRRYFSFLNFLDIFNFFKGFFQSVFLLKKEKPNLIISAGSFISVPLVWAAFFFRIPVLILQLDIRAGLANKLMKPFTKKVAVSFKKSLNDYGEKAVYTGVPLRYNFLNILGKPEELKKEINLEENYPLVLIVGGGTGAEKINEMIIEIAPDLVKEANLIHVCGKNKMKKVSRELEQRYHQYEFLNPDLMAKYLKFADLVVSRAGLGFLSELAYLKKPAIIIPLPDSHQEDNAQILLESQSALILNEKNIDAFVLKKEIRALLADQEICRMFGKNIKENIKSGAESVQKIVKIIDEII